MPCYEVPDYTVADKQGDPIEMTKRALVTLSLLTLLVPAGCKSSENAEAPASNAAAQSATTSDMSTQAGTKAKPQVEKLKGQDIDGGTFTMTVPNGWVKAENPDQAGQFTGVLAYSSDASDTIGGYADVLKATFPYTSPEADKKAVWESVQASTKAAFNSDATFGEDYESNDGFSYSAANNGKKMDAYVYFERKGDTVYYVDAGGDLSKITEKDAWSIIESFEAK
jgi:hypothetical protein